MLAKRYWQRGSAKTPSKRRARHSRAARSQALVRRRRPSMVSCNWYATAVRSTNSWTPPSHPETIKFDAAAADGTIALATRAERQLLSEVEGKALFAAYGIPVVATEVAETPADVGRLAAPIVGQHQRIVVKILADDIAHKSDLGGVRLGLDRAEDAQRAAEDMLQRIGRLRPSARIKGFTVQPMIQRPHAHELIVGMSVDRVFGPLLMFGAGGTAVEVLRDTAHALPPLDQLLALDLMRQTRVWSLL